MSARIQAAEQTIRLIVRAGGEIKRVGQTSIAAVAESDGPQPIDDERLPLGGAHLVEKLAGLQIECVDMAVAEIPDPQSAAQCTEASRRERHAPWRVKLAVLGESPEHLPREIKHVNDAMAFTRDIVVAFHDQALMVNGDEGEGRPARAD